MLPLAQRGAVADLAVVVGVTGLAGNLSSVVVAAPTLRTFAEDLLHSARRHGTRSTAASIELTLRRQDGTEVRIVVSGVEDERAAELIQQTLRDAIGI
jgi:hypothetical protein